MAGIESLDPGVLVLVLLGGFLAGWVDAVVGGGGLIQLPVVLMVPGMTPVQALATNKLGSLFGTSTSAITYFRRTTTPLRPTRSRRPRPPPSRRWSTTSTRSTRATTGPGPPATP